MDGANNSSSFIDSSVYSHTVNTTNSASMSTVKLKFGTASLVGNTNRYLTILPSSTEFEFGTADMTIEFFAYILTNARGKLIGWDTASSAFNIGVEGVPWHAVWAEGPYGSGVFGGTVPRDQWTYWVFVRHSGRCILWINGTIYINSTSNPGTSLTTNAINKNIYVGITNGYLTQGLQAGNYMDELRITKGIARYTLASPPTTPTEAFPEY